MKPIRAIEIHFLDGDLAQIADPLLLAIFETMLARSGLTAKEALELILETVSYIGQIRE